MKHEYVDLAGAEFSLVFDENPNILRVSIEGENQSTSVPFLESIIHDLVTRIKELEKDSDRDNDKMILKQQRLNEQRSYIAELEQKLEARYPNSLHEKLAARLEHESRYYDPDEPALIPMLCSDLADILRSKP